MNIEELNTVIKNIMENVDLENKPLIDGIEKLKNYCNENCNGENGGEWEEKYNKLHTAYIERFFSNGEGKTEDVTEEPTEETDNESKIDTLFNESEM